MMAVQYCTIQDVVSIATEYTRSVTGGNPSIPLDQQDRILTRASEVTRTLLHPHYKTSVIDTYSPDFPPAVVQLCAYIGAALLVEAYQAVITPALQPSVLAGWRAASQCWRDEIANASLRAADGSYVPSTGGVSLGRLPAFDWSRRRRWGRDDRDC